MKNRTKLREQIMIIIYQISLYKHNGLIYNVDNVINENMEIENEFIKDMVYGIITYYDELNIVANKYLNNWSIDRIDNTGAAILRMALYEIKYTDTPPIVVINEAIELCKKYSDDNVRKMVNAVLDKVINE
ncbi:MAG: transcription antitermination factor NusB [Bacilli bacterium]|nr:transcription antitermination factor NusB [Bacilli bacterium]MDD3896041.1 transcription antitermination factor NusB [Bacilli bacterium]MDD4407905.1 transcription antitermination factor NusB [Bacilli bacterium]